MEKYGFVYIWFDKKKKMYYIGCHWGTENDGYICSSNRMRNAYKRRPQDFKRRILKRVVERNVLLKEEFKWLSLIPQDKLGKKYYNHSNKHFGHWSNDPQQVLRMKERNKGKNNPMYGKISWLRGKTLSEETKIKIKAKRALQIISNETRKKISESHLGPKNHFYGKQHSVETKLKMSNAKKNKKISIETRKKMSESAKKRANTPEHKERFLQNIGRL